MSVVMKADVLDIFQQRICVFDKTHETFKDVNIECFSSGVGTSLYISDKASEHLSWLWRQNQFIQAVMIRTLTECLCLNNKTCSDVKLQQIRRVEKHTMRTFILLSEQKEEK